MSPHPLDVIRRAIVTRGDAIRWACVLEATAPKAGNVYPGRSFRDLTFADFVTAAECTANELTTPNASIASRMRAAVIKTTNATKTNVNLGIVLLLGPLVAADESIATHQAESTGAESVLSPISVEAWRLALKQSLASLTPDDGGIVFEAIRVSGAGGMSEVDAMDVRDCVGPVDLVAAMHTARNRDTIALQYATDFCDLLDSVVPVIDREITRTGDVLAGIAEAHLCLLADRPDTLIARKCGAEAAIVVMQHAKQVIQIRHDSHDGIDARQQFDSLLRQDGHARNPGTTADLIAAALYVLLRTAPIHSPRD